MKTISVSGYLVLFSRYLTFKTCDSSFKTCHSLPSLDIIYSRIRNEFTTQKISLKKAGKMRVCSFGSIMRLLHYNHSIGMNSRANHLKFLCPRTSHYACYWTLVFSQPVNCIFWPIITLNCLVAASKLHKHTAQVALLGGPTI